MDRGQKYETELAVWARAYAIHKYGIEELPEEEWVTFESIFRLGWDAHGKS